MFPRESNERELIMRKLMAVVALSLVLVSCGRHGHWSSFFNSWDRSCPGFPSSEEVETVLEKHAKFFEQLQEENLIHWVSAETCPEGAFIAIYHGGEGQIMPVLNMMDEIDAGAEGVDLFFGLPFLFRNV